MTVSNGGSVEVGTGLGARRELSRAVLGALKILHHSCGSMI